MEKIPTFFLSVLPIVDFENHIHLGSDSIIGCCFETSKHLGQVRNTEFRV